MITIQKKHLLEGEIFLLKKQPEEKQIKLSNEEINQKYRKGEMRIVTEQGRIDLHSIRTILDSKQGNKKKYILNPEYQRRKRWDNHRKSLLIESFIMNVPIPPIFLYEIEYAVYEVMDGLQRLTTIYDFYEGKFRLEGLEYWQELNGRTYHELPQNVKSGIDRRYLSSIILLEETAKSPEEAEFLKKIVFERLNSGGAKLNPQEIRNALINGKFNQLCIELARNDLFRKMWHMPLESDGEKKLLGNSMYREMQDVELVLRFFAYRHIGQLRSPIEMFLDRFLEQANHFSDNTIYELKNLFIKTMETLYNIFGKNAFIPPKGKTERKQPSKVIYDPIIQAFAINERYFDKFLKSKEAIKNNLYDDYTKIFPHERHLFEGRYQNKRDVLIRIEYYNNFLKKYI